MTPHPPPIEPGWLAASLERWYACGLGWMGVLVLAFPAYRWREPALRREAQEAQRKSYVKVGAQLFAQHCSACHGSEGTGGGLGPTLRSEEFLDATSDRQLTWLITGGVPGTAMSGYGLDVGGPLTDQQVQQLATYLRGWTGHAPSVPGWRTGARAAPALPVPVPAVRTPAEQVPGSSSAAARADYRTLCSACHGANGEGAVGPAIGTAAYRAASSEARIRERIAGGVPGTAMLAWSRARGGALADAQVDALVALLRAGAFGP